MANSIRGRVSQILVRPDNEQTVRVYFGPGDEGQGFATLWNVSQNSLLLLAIAVATGCNVQIDVATNQDGDKTIDAIQIVEMGVYS
jgi:hypothetical protein